jgi:sortase A
VTERCRRSVGKRARQYPPAVDVRRIVAGIGRSCIAAGVLILLFVGYQLWGTGLYEARTQDGLRADFLDALEAAGADRVPPGGGATTTTTAPRPVPTGEAVAIIRIPKIDVEKAVVEGVGVPDLKKGPGHYPTTPMPGQPGNAAIAGHRTTYGAPFYRLDELTAGDRIDVTTRQGEFTYRVRETKVVKPSQREVLDPTSENVLTLTTCDPRFSAAKRLIVVAALTDEPAEATPRPPVAEPPSPGDSSSRSGGADLAGDESLSGEATSKLPAVLWGLLAVLVWLVTWLLSRRWGRLTAYAMGGPVFLVVLFVFFENFARLLPANV